MAKKISHVETIVCECLHHVSMNVYEKEPPHHTEGRRERLISRPCLSCRKLMNYEREEKAKKWLYLTGGKINSWRSARAGLPLKRMSDGSSFHLKYDAKSKSWMGVLESNEGQFSNADRSIFWLLIKIIKQYGEQINQSDNPSPA